MERTFTSEVTQQTWHKIQPGPQEPQADAGNQHEVTTHPMTQHLLSTSPHRVPPWFLRWDVISKTQTSLSRNLKRGIEEKKKELVGMIDFGCINYLMSSKPTRKEM